MSLNAKDTENEIPCSSANRKRSFDEISSDPYDEDCIEGILFRSFSTKEELEKFCAKEPLSPSRKGILTVKCSFEINPSWEKKNSNVKHEVVVHARSTTVDSKDEKNISGVSLQVSPQNSTNNAASQSGKWKNPVLIEVQEPSKKPPESSSILERGSSTSALSHQKSTLPEKIIIGKNSTPSPTKRKSPKPSQFSKPISLSNDVLRSFPEATPFNPYNWNPLNTASYPRCATPSFQPSRFIPPQLPLTPAPTPCLTPNPTPLIPPRFFSPSPFALKREENMFLPPFITGGAGANNAAPRAAAAGENANLDRFLPWLFPPSRDQNVQAQMQNAMQAAAMNPAMWNLSSFGVNANQAASLSPFLFGRGMPQFPPFMAPAGLSQIPRPTGAFPGLDFGMGASSTVSPAIGNLPNPMAAAAASAMPSVSASSSIGSRSTPRSDDSKSGRWNAMHVRIAWEIYSHQQKQILQRQALGLSTSSSTGTSSASSSTTVAPSLQPVKPNATPGTKVLSSTTPSLATCTSPSTSNGLKAKGESSKSIASTTTNNNNVMSSLAASLQQVNPALLNRPDLAELLRNPVNPFLDPWAQMLRASFPFPPMPTVSGASSSHALHKNLLEQHAKSLMQNGAIAAAAAGSHNSTPFSAAASSGTGSTRAAGSPTTNSASNKLSNQKITVKNLSSPVSCSSPAMNSVKRKFDGEQGKSEASHKRKATTPKLLSRVNEGITSRIVASSDKVEEKRAVQIVPVVISTDNGVKKDLNKNCTTFNESGSSLCISPDIISNEKPKKSPSLDNKLDSVCKRLGSKGHKIKSNNETASTESSDSKESDDSASTTPCDAQQLKQPLVCEESCEAKVEICSNSGDVNESYTNASKEENIQDADNEDVKAF